MSKKGGNTYAFSCLAMLCANTLVPADCGHGNREKKREGIPRPIVAHVRRKGRQIDGMRTECSVYPFPPILTERAVEVRQNLRGLICRIKMRWHVM